VAGAFSRAPAIFCRRAARAVLISTHPALKFLAAHWWPRERSVVRCFFMKQGHITAVEMLPGLNDKEAIEKSHQLFEARKDEAGYEGFEVWERARMVLRHHPVITPRAEAPPPYFSHTLPQACESRTPLADHESELSSP
jgi:hypothetical protein